MTGLNDKTVVIAGPFGLLLQNLLARISEHGADVAVVTDDVRTAQRVCQNIMDMREVSEKYGRAATVESDIRDEASATNCISRSAEIFGGVDVYIDTHLFGLNIPFFSSETLGDIEGQFEAAFKKARLMTDVAAAFLKSRTRGRILYAFHELDMWSADKKKAAAFTTFAEYVRKQAIALAGQNTAVNALAIGVNEEYLLSRFPKATSIQKALQEVLKTAPHARLVDYIEIANMFSFLASPYSAGLSGQILRLDHGL